MIKDKFEIELGKRLRDAEMPVPENAWAFIQNGIRNSPNTAPATSSAPFSNTGFIAGLIIGAAMLISLSVYTHLEPPQTAVAQSKTVETRVIVVHNTDVEAVENVKDAIMDEGTAMANEMVKNKPVVVAGIKDNQDVARKNIVARPITANHVKEVQTKRKKLNEGRELAARKQVQNSIKIPAVAKISADKTSGAAPLSVHFKNRGQGAVHYWKFDSKTDSYDPSPTVLFENPGTYTITLMVENDQGETDEDVVIIKVIEGSKIFIPNSFTPNGDGHNDTYKVASAQNIEEFRMVITNQLGKIVYETIDINGEWEFDKLEQSIANDMFFLTYVAVGTDGVIHSEKLRPIYIFY